MNCKLDERCKQDILKEQLAMEQETEMYSEPVNPSN